MTLDADARAALAAWGGGGLSPLTNRENAVFRAALPDGRTAALRLHRPGYQSDAAIRSELDWCALLAARGFPCPAPIPTTAGALLATAGNRRASLVTWIDGTPFGAAGTPLPGTPAQQSARFAAIGRLLARLHAETDALTLPPGFTRPAWDEAGLIGDDPLWNRFWINPALSDPESALLLTARTSAAEALAAYRAEGADYGLIHADVLRENLLDASGTLHLIDFDDCGFGFRLYDLATALSQSLDEPALRALATALLAGYAETRPLPADPARRLTLFVMLRTMASCGWLITRAPPDDPRLRLYADRALNMSRLWLSGGTLA